MKLVLSTVSWLAGLHLTGMLGTEAVQAYQISASNVIRANSITQPPALLATEVKIPPLNLTINKNDLNKAVMQIEDGWEKQYETYFQTNFSDKSITAKAIADILSRITRQTSRKPALVYIVPTKQYLELVLITPGKSPIHKRILAANRTAILQQVKELTISVSSLSRSNNNSYLQPARQLYRWMIAPLESEMQEQNIDTLIFCMGTGLRAMPLAALHDGQKFLIEKYSFSRIPAFKLTDTIYRDLRKAQVLAMGASIFKEQQPLPAVPVELNAIAENIWQGKSFLNEEFTINNLQTQRASQPFKIIHLATHADFKSGVPSNSYVQFWDTKLTLDKMPQLHWNNPQVELLVLSACKTAIGNEQAELGFAGLAVQAGIKSVVASLWYVSDEGTLGLMTEFYRYLQSAPIKAEALKQAQIAMLKGQVYFKDGQLYSPKGIISLPPELAKLANNKDLSHPYYWAGFTVVGSPW